MKKRRSPLRLTFLYLHQIFQKTNSIVFFITLAVMTAGLFFMGNPWYERSAYLLSPEGFYQAYFQKAFLLLAVGNGVLCASLSISLGWDSRSLDVFLVSRYKRRCMSLSKISALFLVAFLLSLYEYVLLFLVPYLLYPSFGISIRYLLVILYLFLSVCFWMFLSFGMISLVTSFFTPLLVVVVDLILQLFSQAFSDFSKSASYFIPLVSYKDGEFSFPSVATSPLFILAFLLFYIFIYEMKDLKNDS